MEAPGFNSEGVITPQAQWFAVASAFDFGRSRSCPLKIERLSISVLWGESKGVTPRGGTTGGFNFTLYMHIYIYIIYIYMAVSILCPGQQICFEGAPGHFFFNSQI